jgi:hypothetical protein
VGAEQAVNALVAQGFLQNDISVLMTGRTRGEHFAIEETTKAPEGIAVGGIAGGALGAVAAGLTAVATVAAPGIGLFAAGPIVAALTGIGAGATAGGIIGGLVGLGMKEHEAKLYDDEIRRGGMLVGVRPASPDQAELARRVLRENGALNRV